MPTPMSVLTMRAMDERGNGFPKAQGLNLIRTQEQMLRWRGKATRKMRLTGTTANMAKSGGMNGSHQNHILKPTTCGTVDLPFAHEEDEGSMCSLTVREGLLSARWKSVGFR